MSHWNHRVIKFLDGNDPWLEICEVHYDDNNEVFGHTAKGVSVCGSNVQEIKQTLERMLLCLDKPILDAMK